MHSVEKIDGASISAIDAVYSNVMLFPEDKYHRIFVVSAYEGITDALLESSDKEQPGVYQYIAEENELWRKKLESVEQRMLLVNDNLLADPFVRREADEFVSTRIKEAELCIDSLLETCRYGQFSLGDFLCQIRELLASVGEAHSAYNTYLKLRKYGVKARFIDLSDWKNEGKPSSLDEILLQVLDEVDLSCELPIVTGYASCDEGLLNTCERGYADIILSRLAVLSEARKVVSHKNYHLTTADPEIVTSDIVSPVKVTNFDVAERLAHFDMEAIHPYAGKELCRKGIPLVVKNTFEPENSGTVISPFYKSEKQQVETVTGTNKLFSVEVKGTSFIEQENDVTNKLMLILGEANLSLLDKEIGHASITYFIACEPSFQSWILHQLKSCFPDAVVNSGTVALVCAVGSSIDPSEVIRSGVECLGEEGIIPKLVRASAPNIDVQFYVSEEDYTEATSALYESLIVQ